MTGLLERLLPKVDIDNMLGGGAMGLPPGMPAPSFAENLLPHKMFMKNKGKPPILDPSSGAAPPFMSPGMQTLEAPAPNFWSNNGRTFNMPMPPQAPPAAPAPQLSHQMPVPAGMPGQAMLPGTAPPMRPGGIPPIDMQQMQMMMRGQPMTPRMPSAQTVSPMGLMGMMGRY